MAFQFEKARRKHLKTKVAMFGPSGSGKTYSALLLARGMVGPQGKIAVINTEANRGEIYATEFEYDLLNLDSPYSPERYVEAMQAAVAAGYDILIIDSATHEWDGDGGILDLNSKMGGKFSNWATLTPRHNKFVNWITDSDLPIIFTMRGKDEYLVSTDDRGKQSVEKVGMGAKQRQGLEYEVHIAFRIDMQHNAHPEKDNTHLFENNIRPLSVEDGKKITSWASTGESADEANARIEARLNELRREHTTKTAQITTMFEKYKGHMNEKQVGYAQRHIEMTFPLDINRASDVIIDLAKALENIEDFCRTVDSTTAAQTA